jgi:hypothetical protein
VNFKFKLSRRLAGMKGAVLLSAALWACAGDDPLSSGPALPDTVITSNAPAVSLNVTPAVDSVGVGGTLQLVAVARDAQGGVTATPSFTWWSTNDAVATVSPAGVVTAVASGEAFIIAQGETLRDTATVRVRQSVTPPQPQPSERVGYHVAPNGSAAGAGTAGSPWSLSAALSGAGGRIQPGDTVWMHGGTYSGEYLGTVSGSSGRPVVFRQYPGERATIDGHLRVNGHDVAMWGFEIMRSAPSGVLPALEARGARQKFINLVIHDAAQQGITFWDEAVDSEIYGCIVYNNGTHENLDHGTYVHNMSGTKLIADNVFFNNLAYGIHVYAGPGDGTQRNVHVVGNVSFNNGTISSRYPAKGNIIIGAEDVDEGMRAVDNMTYFSGTAGDNIRIGYLARNRDVVVTGNTAFGGGTALMMGDWTSATVQNNTLGGAATLVDLRDSPSGYTWSGNRYYGSASASAWYSGTSLTSSGSAFTLTGWQSSTGLGSGELVAGSAPTQTQVFVRKNKYENGRALIVVYNHGAQGSVSVSLSGVLAGGQRYEIRNVQDMFGTPVAGGTYNGGSVTLPMTGVAPPARLGRSTAQPPRTGPNFDTFVVVPL